MVTRGQQPSEHKIVSAPKLDPQHISLLECRFTMAGEEGKVAASIRAKLTERFKPEHLEVIPLEHNEL